jgi:hypothetical protein
MADYYIPGLGVVQVREQGYSGNYVSIIISDVPVEDMRYLGAKELEDIAYCGGCEKARRVRVRGDYLCTDCRDTDYEDEFQYAPTWELRRPAQETLFEKP